MSIKPIDFQIMLPRTSEASKVQNDLQQKNQSAYEQVADSVKHKAEDNLKQVHSQDKTQQAVIRDKQGKNQGNNKGKKKNNKEENEQNSNMDTSIKTSTIDIKI